MIPLGSHVGRILKRFIDLVASAVGLLVLSPLFVIIGLLIKTENRGPVFFRQTKVGIRGEPFRIWKLRTLRADAAGNGPDITPAGDSRVMGVRRVLRRSKLMRFPSS